MYFYILVFYGHLFSYIEERRIQYESIQYALFSPGSVSANIYQAVTYSSRYLKYCILKYLTVAMARIQL